MDWIKSSLKTAVALELSTLPPYLVAGWTIAKPKQGGGWEILKANPAYRSIRLIALEEMLHLGLVCNLLGGIGGAIPLLEIGKALQYPGPLPGGVIPDLTVGLERFSDRLVQDTFLRIEFPEKGPIVLLNLADQPPTIGSFYSALQTAFEQEQPSLDLKRQIDLQSLLQPFPPSALPTDFVTVASTVCDAKAIIERIKEQGEGNEQSPLDLPGATTSTPPDFAHYYRFKEMATDRKIIQVDGAWKLSDRPEDRFGNPDANTEVVPMAPVPIGGYPGVSEVIAFNESWSDLLVTLEKAWAKGSAGIDDLDAGVGDMSTLTTKALTVFAKPLPNGSGEVYGPDFRVTATK